MLDLVRTCCPSLLFFTLNVKICYPTKLTIRRQGINASCATKIFGTVIDGTLSKNFIFCVVELNSACFSACGYHFFALLCWYLSDKRFFISSAYPITTSSPLSSCSHHHHSCCDLTDNDFLPQQHPINYYLSLHWLSRHHGVPPQLDSFPFPITIVLSLKFSVQSWFKN